ncbi:MAG: hypothetical protein U0984_10900 [Prosthecobacter sp.]|nr:hypothetical protein [Prosthecobacter sp.]
MSDSEFPAPVIELIRKCAPSFAAVELLVYLEARPEMTWNIEELFACLKPRGFSFSCISENVAKFQRCSLLEFDSDGRFRYCPAAAEVKEQVKQLSTAFSERPVSLIRVVYAIADDPIQSFADSFRLKTSES